MPEPSLSPFAIYRGYVECLGFRIAELGSGLVASGLKRGL